MRPGWVRLLMAVEVYPLLARGVFATYGYFVMDGDTGHGLLVDPGAQARLFMRAAAERGWTVESILLTHGHFDHFGAVEELRAAWGVPVYAHESSPCYLSDPALNLSSAYGPAMALEGTEALHDGDLVESPACPAVSLEVLHVPGHTLDSCAFYSAVAGVAFVGDTVYEGGPGLTVFPTGDEGVLASSVRDKLLALPDDTLLLSGHSRPMAVGELRTRVATR